MSKVSRLEVIETGARRQWTAEEKQRIVAESFALPRNTSATARRHGMSSGQLFTWRRLAREGKLVLDDDGANFVPAIIGPERSDLLPESPQRLSVAAKPPDGRMEIVLCNARRVIVSRDVDTAVLRVVIEVLEGG